MTGLHCEAVLISSFHHIQYGGASLFMCMMLVVNLLCIDDFLCWVFYRI